MFVPCPHCGFLVALIVADGGSPQRCPRCRSELRGEGGPKSASPTSADEVQGDRDIARSRNRVASDAPDTGIAPAGGDADSPLASGSPQEAAAVENTAAPATAPKPLPGTSTRTGRRRKPGTPSFARVASRPRTRGPSWPEMLAVSALGVLLAAQLVLAQRTELAANERWRPAIGAVCDVLMCDLPAWREPDAYTMLARSVQPASGKPGILSVQASFRNDARWPQPWPELVLNLSDINGQPVAARAFEPSEYRVAETTASPATLTPGQSASVEFEIIEPALPVVSFTFDFR